MGWSWQEARGEEEIYRRRPERTFAWGEGKGGDRSNRLPSVRSTYWDHPLPSIVVMRWELLIWTRKEEERLYRGRWKVWEEGDPEAVGSRE